MNVKLLCLEDGIVATGFRKIAGYIEHLHPDTRTHYLSTHDYRSVWKAVTGTIGGRGALDADAIDEAAQGLRDADVVGFSSMTGYADLTKAIIRRVREVSPRTYLIWGGIHPIIHPEDAIQSGVDAVCTGEGELAFEELYHHLNAGTDETSVRNFWFRRGDQVIRNGFLPLLTSAQLDALPLPKYGEREWIYRQGQGFVPVTRHDYLRSSGLSYIAVWSIGCPFVCNYCGNTKFIENDGAYRKIRHPSPRYVIEEVMAARRKLPHISSVQFQDDSFMALPLSLLERFAEEWRARLGMPFAVYGVIPNYVRRDKIEVLTWAGMNRIRMGIQSGSQRILDFYERPTPVAKIEAAAAVTASFAPRYHIPPAYDIIMDNPIESRKDVDETLELLYRLARPFHLFMYSLKVIPNTGLARAMRERGIALEDISDGYASLPPRWANVMLCLIAICRPPRWLWNRLMKRVRASSEPQRLYPFLATVLRAVYIGKRAVDHLRFMDFSNISGYPGWIAWRLGVVSFWQRHLTPRPPRPALGGRNVASRPLESGTQVA
jgi:radical SAM superfamily enzyme YgiQ (UPF0313 family)